MNYAVRANIVTSVRPFGRMQHFPEGRMPSIQQRTLKFKPPAATPRNADIVSYRLRVAPDGGVGSASNYNLAFIDLGKPALDPQGFIVVNLASIPSLANLDGTFDLAVTAVDDAGNESDFLPLEGAVIDFVAPNSPTDISVA